MHWDQCLVFTMGFNFSCFPSIMFFFFFRLSYFSLHLFLRRTGKKSKGISAGAGCISKASLLSNRERDVVLQGGILSHQQDGACAWR